MPPIKTPVASSNSANATAVLPMIATLKPQPTQKKLKRGQIVLNPFKKAILGDIFGTTSSGGERSMLGLMYRSRVEERKAKFVQAKIEGQDHTDGDGSNVGSSMATFDVIDSGSESDDDNLEIMNPRQQLAMTIRNWSVMPENDIHIIKEGAVHALIALAGVDDAGIKKCCASALYYLSSRESNREELLALGAATGVITLSMQVRSWKIAKMCAMTLCFLTMQPQGEAIMAKDGAILALVILLGIKGQKLLPVCVQALYNLTCVVDPFKGMERILKALLNIPPQTGFDHAPYLVKALVNCSRYTWMRLRIIEDGALAAFQILIPTLSSRENRVELVLSVLSCMRLLSDSIGCRNDMLSKCSLDILELLLPFCLEEGRLLTIKVLHNLLRGTTLSFQFFELSAEMVCKIVANTSNEITLQYAAGCLYIFALENMRGSAALAVRVIDVMPILLQSLDATTQFFAIATSGNLFFSALCNDQRKLELLVKSFVMAGPNIIDIAAIEALAVALAKLSQEAAYMMVLEKLDLFNQILTMLLQMVKTHTDNNIILECCCVAICRISLQLDYISVETQKEIAGVFFELLEVDNFHVLDTTISAIRAVGNHGLCLSDLLSEPLLKRVAKIVVEHKDEVSLRRMCCAVLAVSSNDPVAHVGLSSDDVMNMLFSTTRDEDSKTRELVATALCNISVNEGARQHMIDKGVVEVLATLSGATSEIIQELCAKCICNLTHSVELHSKMISNNVLQTILMISLVRSVASSTKLLCARALLNLMTDQNVPALKEAGAIRVFATLSVIDNVATQIVCARGLLMFTNTVDRRENIVQRRAVLQAMFSMVKCPSSRVRIMIGTAICNLLACPVTQKLTINAGALSVLKIIVAMDHDVLRERTARIIINLTQVSSLHSALLREPLASMLMLILQQSGLGYTFDCAVIALSCMSRADLFRLPLIDKGCVTALVGCVVLGRITDTAITTELCRCLCHLSYSRDRAEIMIVDGHILMALHAIHRTAFCSADAARMMAIIIRNLSEESCVRQFIVSQDAFILIAALIRDYPEVQGVISKAAIIVMHNLSLETMLHEDLMRQGLLATLHAVIAAAPPPVSAIPPPPLGSPSSPMTIQRHLVAANSVSLSVEDIVYITKTIKMVSQTASCHAGIVGKDIIKLFNGLFCGLNDLSRHQVACTLSNVASSKQCRQLLVEQEAANLLIALSHTKVAQTQTQCALALGYLSEITRVNDGVVASLLMLSLRAEELDCAARSCDDSVSTVSDSDMYSTTSINISNKDAGFTGLHATKSLHHMIKDGLMRDKAKHGLNVDHLKGPGPGSLVRANSDITCSIDEAEVKFDVAEAAATANRVKLEMLDEKRSFQHYEYLTVKHDYLTEDGGMASPLQLDLPLPGIAADRVLDVPDRHSMLTKLLASDEPLPKDMTDPNEEFLKAGKMDAVQEDTTAVTERVAVVTAVVEDDDLGYSSSSHHQFTKAAKRNMRNRLAVTYDHFNTPGHESPRSLKKKKNAGAKIMSPTPDAVTPSSSSSSKLPGNAWHKGKKPATAPSI